LAQQFLSHHRELLSGPTARLAALDPQQVLDRGFALVTDQETGKVVTRKQQLRPRQGLDLRFADGGAAVEVTALKKD